MALFEIKNNKLNLLKKISFKNEKELQRLIEDNLEVVFNCRFVRSEFSTGKDHAGRIDTLALSVDGNPVIIEYKIKESSDLVNQSLFYLHWIQDHKGDFEIAVQKELGNNMKIDWSSIRVICISPKYRKYDLHAVQVMGTNIELWKYHLFSNGTLYLEEEFQSTETALTTKIPEQTETQYNFEYHLVNKSSEVKIIIQVLREFIMNLDSSIKEVFFKYVIAYRTTQSFIWVLTRSKKQLKIRLKLDKKDLIPIPKIKYRDTTDLDWASGNTEFILDKEEDVEELKHYIELAYNKVGG